MAPLHNLPRPGSQPYQIVQYALLFPGVYSASELARELGCPAPSLRRAVVQVIISDLIISDHRGRVGPSFRASANRVYFIPPKGSSHVTRQR